MLKFWEKKKVEPEPEQLVLTSINEDGYPVATLLAAITESLGFISKDGHIDDLYGTLEMLEECVPVSFRAGLSDKDFKSVATKTVELYNMIQQRRRG